MLIKPISYTLVALLLASTLITPAMAAQSWKPQSSERLVKLPPSYLKKSIDHDFAQSELGAALQQAEEDIAAKGTTLGDLQRALETADGDVRTELRYQFLAEKRAYIDMMSARNKMRKNHLNIKKRLHDNMLGHLNAKNAPDTPQRQELLALQNKAFKRFESSVDQVDKRIFETHNTGQSRYAQQYSENMGAIEKLAGRINVHKMNTVAISEDGVALSREEQIRRMAAEVQTEIAILEQEEMILGYMAKLVALDAMAMNEEGMEAELADSDAGISLKPAQNVSYFMTN